MSRTMDERIGAITRQFFQEIPGYLSQQQVILGAVQNLGSSTRALPDVAELSSTWPEISDLLQEYNRAYNTYTISPEQLNGARVEDFLENPVGTLMAKGLSLDSYAGYIQAVSKKRLFDRARFTNPVTYLERSEAVMGIFWVAMESLNKGDWKNNPRAFAESLGGYDNTRGFVPQLKNIRDALKQEYEALTNPPVEKTSKGGVRIVNQTAGDNSIQIGQTGDLHIW